MSAICAVLRADGSPSAASEAAALLREMREYGDETSLWAPDPERTAVALGCIPWRVTPEDAWHRGVVASADGLTALVADARIDNRSELAAALEVRADELPRMCDAALILAAYEAWGTGAPRRLIGDFAFAVWDGRRRALFCARDVMGHRVLAYHSSAQGLAVATTPNALAALPRIGARLDEQKVAEFLVLLQSPETTFFAGIRRLPAGHTMTARDGELRIERYWSPEPERELALRTDDEYVEGFLEVFEAAVRSHLRSACPVGILASGGLDSSSVAVVAAEQMRASGCRLPTFHAAPPDGFDGKVHRGWIADESGEVAAMAAMHPSLDLRIRRSTGGDPLADADTSFRMTGAPPRNVGNAPWIYGSYRAAASEGVRVMLVGNKGNATISHSGHQSLRDAALRGDFRRVWREVNAVARRSRKSRRAVLKRMVIEPLTPYAVGAALRRLRKGKPVPVWEATASAIDPTFARATRVEERMREMRRAYLIARGMSDLEFRTTVLTGGVDSFDLYSGYRPWFGVETRDPTADRRVIEYCFAVPSSQYLRDGEDRSLIRRAMRGRLPESIRTRTTLGAQAPDWIEWLPGLRGELRAELERLERSETARRMLDLGRLRSLMDRWPERLTAKDDAEYYMRLLRGLMVGRFVRWFEETYS